MPLDRIEEIQGLDLNFNGRVGDLADIVDFGDISGGETVRQEVERLFNFTPLGCFHDDPTYGIDLNRLIGTSLPPRTRVGIVVAEVQRALEHPSFVPRFRVASVNGLWLPQQPQVVQIFGALQVFGAERPNLFGFFEVPSS